MMNNKSGSGNLSELGKLFSRESSGNAAAVDGNAIGAIGGMGKLSRDNSLNNGGIAVLQREHSGGMYPPSRQNSGLTWARE